jgi:hypothetical protein
MKSDSIIRNVFGHFQNLNLLVLIHDLRAGRAVQGAWAFAGDLCPVAHGMPMGQLVSTLRYMGQVFEPARASAYAAGYLGANPIDVQHFVDWWDAHVFSSDWLLGELESLWNERREDAEAVQEVISGNPCSPTFLPVGDDILSLFTANSPN